MDDLRKAHLQEIHLAFEGKLEMLKACFGAGEAEDNPMADRPVFRSASTVEDFDRMFGKK